MECLACRPGYHAQHGEWQCWSCGAWYFTEGPRQHPVYARVPTAEQMTAQEQVRIVLACRRLTRHGLRLGTHFGWGNALQMADALPD
jgi:hypothetical protein